MTIFSSEHRRAINALVYYLHNWTLLEEPHIVLDAMPPDLPLGTRVREHDLDKEVPFNEKWFFDLTSEKMAMYGVFNSHHLETYS